MTEWLTQRDAADRLGLTDRMLQKHAKSENPPPRDPETGRYPWPEVRDWYQAMRTREELRRRGLSEQTGGTAFIDARARKVGIEAEIKELQLDELRRELVRKGDVLQLVRAPLEAVAREAAAWPRQAAPALAREAGIGQARALEILEQLVEDLLRRLRELGPDAAS